MESYRELHQKSIEDPAGFWESVASELQWDEPWDTAMEWAAGAEEAVTPFDSEGPRGGARTFSVIARDASIAGRSFRRHQPPPHHAQGFHILFGPPITPTCTGQSE